MASLNSPSEEKKNCEETQTWKSDKNEETDYVAEGIEQRSGRNALNPPWIPEREIDLRP